MPLPFTLSLYASPFHSLSLYPFHLPLSLSLSLSPPSLSLLSFLPLYISPSTFLSLHLLLSIILFGVSNGRFSPCFFIIYQLQTDFLFIFNTLRDTAHPKSLTFAARLAISKLYL